VNPLGKFPVFRHNELTVVEVPLTDEEIEECLKMGKKRTELDEKKLGWIYRHNGMSSPRAHAIGFMGEVAVEKLFNSLDMERDKDYVRNNPFVEKYEDIKQDFTIGDSDIGVKSAENDSLEDATSYDSFLYPAKKEEGESKRVLPYPDYLIQTVVSVNGKKCWICGFVDKETIVQSPVRQSRKKPTHFIPIDEYEPVEDLINLLMNQ
jgi:hypothetical protein